MDVKKISEKNNVTKIFLNGTGIVFMNSIRRAVMNSVPTMAIENINFYENTSVMFDEMLAHRLALLPVKTDLKTYKVGEKVKMLLEKEGPCTVYSGDIESTEPSIEVIEKTVPVVKLAKGQRVKLEMDAVVGTGKEHSKWQPALVSFNEVPNISISMPDAKEQKKFLAKFPEGMFDVKAGKIVLADPMNANIDLVEYAAKLSGNDSQIETGGKSFVMTIENFGCLETVDVLLEASKTLEESVREMREELKKI